MSLLARCRVVLVRTHYAGNLGSVARVMSNFGLSDLVLVAPVVKHQSQDAMMMATHGREVLAGARVVNTLAEAVADSAFVLSTSGEIGGLARKGYWGTPEEKLPQLLDTLARAPTALVFGPEPHGLTVDEITACHGMMFIPSAPEHESLNLAQAVAVVLYELRKLWLKRDESEVPSDPPADFAAQERMFNHLREALIAQRFLWDFRADGIFHVLRTVITRGQPTMKELRIFHGLAQQLGFIARQFGVPHPTVVAKTNLANELADRTEPERRD
jgi:tRNA/rRNA methyltransferase